jgi:hypothetical protein
MEVERPCEDAKPAEDSRQARRTGRRTAYMRSIHFPPSPFGARPTASTARRKQIGKQSYLPTKLHPVSSRLV